MSMIPKYVPPEMEELPEPRQVSPVGGQTALALAGMAQGIMNQNILGMVMGELTNQRQSLQATQMANVQTRNQIRQQKADFDNKMNVAGWQSEAEANAAHAKSIADLKDWHTKMNHKFTLELAGAEHKQGLELALKALDNDVKERIAEADRAHGVLIQGMKGESAEKVAGIRSGGADKSPEDMLGKQQKLYQVPLDIFQRNADKVLDFIENPGNYPDGIDLPREGAKFVKVGKGGLDGYSYEWDDTRNFKDPFLAVMYLDQFYNKLPDKLKDAFLGATDRDDWEYTISELKAAGYKAPHSFGVPAAEPYPGNQ
jgi:hypothetical protein